MQILQDNIKDFGTKLDQVSKLRKTMKEEQERIKNLVNNWEVKQKGIEDKLSFAGDWHMKNNLINFGIDEQIIF